MALKVLVVGCGNMGKSHARAYHQLEGYEIVGLVSRGPESREALSMELGGLPTYGDFYEALAKSKPDVVSINTYPETHAEYATKSLEAGCHLFIEKPLANTVEEAQQIVDLAIAKDRKLVIGYILRVHPTWTAFIEQAKQLGKPLVMRMNLNQQSTSETWKTHKELMKTMSPIVDCGVHYVDVMCLMTGANPIRVSGMGARLSEELVPGMYNYGHLQVTFDDGSVGWYEAGWGPMMSETAYFIKDVVGPKGCVSITEEVGERSDDSDNVESHTRSGGLKVHWADRDESGHFSRPDQWISMEDEPDHDGLCLLEQKVLLDAIQNDTNLEDHMRDAVNSLRIVLAADESFKTGKTIEL